MSVAADHRKLRQLVEERKTTINDKKLFTSALMCRHFEDMAAAITRRYACNRRISVEIKWKPSLSDVAYTDNSRVFINAGSKYVKQCVSRRRRYDIICGLFAHELGHVLYTDFLEGQSYFNSISNHVWYPSVPPADTPDEKDYLTEIFEYMKNEFIYKVIIQMTVRQISNIIEDGYVEERILRNFPGSLGYGLRVLRGRHYDDMPTLSEMIEDEKENKVASILQLILMYVKFGRIKYGDAPISDERVQFVFSLLPVLDKAVMSGITGDRLSATNTVLIKLWPYIKEQVEEMKKHKPTDSASDGSGTENEPETDADECPETEAEEEMQKLLSGLEGTSAEPEGCSEPVDAGNDPEPFNGTLTARKETAAEAELNSSENENSEAEPEGGIPCCGVSSGSDAEADRRGLGIITDDDYEGIGEEMSSQEVEQILGAIAERDTMCSLEEDRLLELNNESRNLSFGDIHEGVTTVIHRMTSVPDSLRDQYMDIAPSLLHISKLLQRNIRQQLKDVRQGGKQTGLLMGRRLDSHSLVRNDGKCFYKNSLPQEMPELSVALLLDESGSMSSYSRYVYAKATAVVIYDFCKSLNIPVCVYGHSTGYSSEYGHTMDLYSYAEFESIDSDDRFRLMDIRARESNRDGMALRYVAEKLSKRPEQERILILVSDGRPADLDYEDEKAEADIQKVVREYSRKGILFVSAAIGDDKPLIERIYGNAFLDISDMTKLPEKLTGVIRKHLRV